MKNSFKILFLMMLALALNGIIGEETAKNASSKITKDTKTETSDSSQKSKNKNIFIGLSFNNFLDEGHLTVPLERYYDNKIKNNFKGIDISYLVNKDFNFGFKYFSPIDSEIKSKVGYLDFSYSSYAYYKKEIKVEQTYDFYFRYFPDSESDKEKSCKFCYLLLSVGKYFPTEVDYEKQYPFPSRSSQNYQANNISLGTMSPDSIHIFQKPTNTLGVGVGYLRTFNNFYFDFNVAYKLRERNNPDILVNANYFNLGSGQTLSLIDVIIAQEAIRSVVKERGYIKVVSIISFSVGLAF